MECQIVAVPGWNDGAALQRSLEDLAGLYPHVSSVSIVPVGLTCHREKLTPLSPYTPEQARATIAQVESFAAECFEKYGSHIFYCSDEMYDFLNAIPMDELADLMIVSHVDLVKGEGGVKGLTEGLGVSVAHAAGNKCLRCWKFDTAVGEDGLCPRCAKVLG